MRPRACPTATRAPCADGASAAPARRGPASRRPPRAARTASASATSVSASTAPPSTARPSSVSSDVARSRELRRIRRGPQVDAEAEDDVLQAVARRSTLRRGSRRACAGAPAPRSSTTMSFGHLICDGQAGGARGCPRRPPRRRPASAAARRAASRHDDRDVEARAGGENHVAPEPAAPGGLRRRDDGRAFGRAALGERRRDVVGRADFGEEVRAARRSVRARRAGASAAARSAAAAQTSGSRARRGQASGSISKLRSAAGAECVSAPTDT